MKKQVKFSNWLCNVVFAEYRNGGTAIRLVDAVDGMPVATASVWVGGLERVDADEIAIKDYSENEGMLTALIEGDIVHPPHRLLDGFPIVRLK
jgi:hypothetical protein